jgi:hypothetical protein
MEVSMATYHVMAVPKPGADPDPQTRPLAPKDILADDDAHALNAAESLIDQATGELAECFDGTEGLEGFAAAERALAEVDLWQTVVQRVSRRPVAIEPEWRTSDRLKGGVGSTTSFRVLVGGTDAGLLELAGGCWWLDSPTGPLAPLDGTAWPNDTVWVFSWPDVPLAEIRAMLETDSP